MPHRPRLPHAVHRRPRLRLAGWLALPAALVAVAVLGTADASSHSAPPGTYGHEVVTGDTLWSLAQRSGTTVSRLQAINGLHNDIAVLGTVLYLPTSTSTYSSSAGSGSTSSYGSTATYGSTPPQTVAPAAGYASSVATSRAILSSRGYVSQSYAESLVRSEALRQGVSVSLALALADQESGFQQGVVSGTDAVGVMQLEPATARWIGTVLLGTTVDRYDVYDNVRAGVALLHNLLDVTDLRSAIASYYQGLRGVQSHGLYSDTVAYVNSVLALRTRFL